MSGPNTLVFVRRTGLILAGKRTAAARLSFGEKLVHNMDVLDSTQLRELCHRFFTDQDIKHHKVLVVLDQDIVFEKKLDKEDLRATDEALESFVSAMPFEAGKRAAFSVAVDDRTHLYGTNYELFFTIIEGIEAAGGKIVSITPLMLYGLEAGQKLKDVVGRLLKDSTVRKQANFARSEPL